MIETIRAFIAVNLDVDSTRRAAELVKRARALGSSPRASWVAPTNLHVTLRFLGDIDRGLCPALVDVIREAARTCPVGELGLGPVGAFPRPESARVVHLGVRDERGELGALHRAVSAGLSALGIDEETRPYVPHLTLARCRQPASLARWVAELGPSDLGPCRATECVLYQSELRKAGAEYTALGRVSLLPQGTT